MNTDEYDTRELLSNAQIVAFANSIYHYRKHSESITAKFSIKYFDSLIIDKMLDNLFSNQFGADSPQTRLVRQYRLGEIINHQTTLFKTKKCLSGIEKKKAQKLIRENYSDIDKSKIFNESKIRRILYTKSYHLFITHTYINHLRKRIFCKE